MAVAAVLAVVLTVDWAAAMHRLSDAEQQSMWPLGGWFVAALVFGIAGSVLVSVLVVHDTATLGGLVIIGVGFVWAFVGSGVGRPWAMSRAVNATMLAGYDQLPGLTVAGMALAVTGVFVSWRSASGGGRRWLVALSVVAGLGCLAFVAATMARAPQNRGDFVVDYS